MGTVSILQAVKIIGKNVVKMEIWVITYNKSHFEVVKILILLIFLQLPWNIYVYYFNVVMEDFLGLYADIPGGQSIVWLHNGTSK